MSENKTKIQKKSLLAFFEFFKIKMGGDKNKKTFRAKELNLKIPTGLVKTKWAGPKKSVFDKKTGKIKIRRAKTPGTFNSCTTRAAELAALNLQKLLTYVLEECKKRGKPGRLLNAKLLSEVLNDKQVLSYGMFPNRVFGHYHCPSERPPTKSDDLPDPEEPEEQEVADEDHDDSVSSSSSSSSDK
jgi:hypothetical protein